MSAPLFLAFCLGAVAVILVWLSYYVRHACDDLAVPDCHGDYPAIPAELEREAREEARRRFASEQGMRAFPDATVPR